MGCPPIPVRAEPQSRNHAPSGKLPGRYRAFAHDFHLLVPNVVLNLAVERQYHVLRILDGLHKLAFAVKQHPRYLMLTVELRWSGKPEQNGVVSSLGCERHFETR